MDTNEATTGGGPEAGQAAVSDPGAGQGRPASPTTQTSDERQAEEGTAGRAVGPAEGHPTWVERLNDVLTDERLAYLFYTAGLGTDAYGRAQISRNALMAGAGLLSGIDAVQALWSPDQRTAVSPAQAVAAWDKVVHNVLYSAHYALQIAMPVQTIRAILPHSSDPLFVELDRSEARKASRYGFVAAGSSLAAFLMSVRRQLDGTDQGAEWTVYKRLRVAIVEALKESKDRGKLMDAIGLSIEAWGRLKMDPLLITIGTAVQLGHYGLSAVQTEMNAQGRVATRSTVAAAKIAMFATYIGTTAQTWRSVEQGDPDSPIVRALRDGVRKSSIYSAAAAAAAATVLVIAVAARRSGAGQRRAEAAQQRSLDPSQPAIRLAQSPGPAASVGSAASVASAASQARRQSDNANRPSSPTVSASGQTTPRRPYSPAAAQLTSSPEHQPTTGARTPSSPPRTPPPGQAPGPLVLAAW